MKNYKFIMLFFLAFFFMFSCNEEKLEVVNPNQLSEGSFFQTEDEFTAAVNAIYANLQSNQMYNREYFFLHDLLSDEMVGNPQLEAHRRDLLEHNISPDNSIVVAVWTASYRTIHRANLVLAKLDEAPEDPNFTEAERNRLRGEALFLRAWSYYELVSLWGPVPKVTVPVSEITEEGFPRVSEEEIHALIFQDLATAEGFLPLKSQYASTELGRATKGAAQALAGKVRMWTGEYPQAITEFQKVIDSDEYSIEDVPYIDNFTEENENNEESIFEVQFFPTGTGDAWSADGSGNAEVTFRGQEYTPQAGWNNVDPNPDLVAAFEPGDIRYDASFWLDGESFNGGQSTMSLGRPGWEKYSTVYKQPLENANSGINFRVIRYADVLLMMAEAQNEVTGVANALPYVNMVRNRAGLPDLASADISGEEAMFDIIVHERRIELAGEQIRNRDIRRWRREGKLDSEPIIYYESHHDLLPVPAVELLNNPALTLADQNAGY